MCKAHKTAYKMGHISQQINKSMLIKRHLRQLSQTLYTSAHRCFSMATWSGFISTHFTKNQKIRSVLFILSSKGSSLLHPVLKRKNIEN